MTRFDAFRNIFLAGTVSGAPKVRAMELIGELEKERCGAYGGAVGYWGCENDSINIEDRRGFRLLCQKVRNSVCLANRTLICWQIKTRAMWQAAQKELKPALQVG